MAKPPSKSKKSTKNPKKSPRHFFARLISKMKPKTSHPRVRLHKSFRRSYREDYLRSLETPGLLAHIFATFKIIFKNWKLFLPFLLIIVALNIILVGLMSEATYTQFKEILDDTSMKVAGGEIGGVAKAGLLLISTITTGGLSGTSSESALVFAVIIFLIVWLVTIFILRHRLAGHQIKLRDGFYNALTPLISTFVVLGVIFFQCIPAFIFIVVYSAAVTTNFLATPFYALLFFIFASIMLIFSGYLVSSSLIALIAVTAPGLYPLKALRTASDLMAGRRIKLIIRLVALFLASIFVWVVIMLPIILFDIWLKTFAWASGIPIVPVCLLIMTCFTMIFITTYLYLYYRWTLDYDKK